MLLDSARGSGFDLKAELRGKAPGAQHPQRILLKPQVRVSNAANHAALQILAPMKAVGDAAV